MSRRGDTRAAPVSRRDDEPAQRIESRELTAEALAAACLERIAERVALGGSSHRLRRRLVGGG